MRRKKNPWLLVLSLAAGLLAAPAITPSHGPRNGYLLISGGGAGIQEFVRIAGGAKARIVVIPTASLTEPATPEELATFCRSFAGSQCTVVHTTVPMVADTAAFAEPIKTATGVWLEGGRQWRLADAYLGTYLLHELFALLDRGGIIGGGSAGASIQASFMVRGDSTKDDNTIMIAPGHTTGFGLITNVAIDQHVEARRRENDLAVVMKARPELLGLGLDQSCSITVHGDEFVTNGPGRVAVWDGKDHDGRGYYHLHTGDKFDLVTRTATLAPAKTQPVSAHKEVVVDPKLFDGYVGRYKPAQDVVFAITREGDRLFSQMSRQAKTEMFPAGDRDYFLKEVDAQITFETDSRGRATSLVIHQNGRDTHFKRIEGEHPAPPQHKEAAVDPKVFDGYVGRYQLAPKRIMTVTREGGHYFTQLTGQPPVEIFPESDREYFVKGFDAQITFRPGSMTLHQNGHDSTLQRIESEPPAPAQRKAIAVAPRLFDRYVGRYALAPGFTLSVTRAGDRYFTQATGQPRIEIFPETERDYFLKDVDTRITFAATGVVLHDNGRDIPVKRVE